MWKVYILECSDKSLYTGITNNLTERIEKHNQGKASKYTRSRTPVTLLYSENYPDRAEATRREMEIKSFPRKKKQKLISEAPTNEN